VSDGVKAIRTILNCPREYSGDRMMILLRAEISPKLVIELVDIVGLSGAYEWVIEYLDCHCCACVGGDIVGIVVVVENLSLL
jgi:hypothetical protein